MKCLFLFSFGLFLGFFDIFFCCFLGAFFFIILVFDFRSSYFGGFLFCDSFSFFLIYLRSVIFFLCFFTRLLDKWRRNGFYRFNFFIFSIFFLLLCCFIVFRVFFFYAFFEIIFIIIFFFLVCWGYSPERLQASYYMVFYTLVVSFPFFVFVIFNEVMLVSLNFLTFWEVSSYWWVFVFFVFFVKLPVYFVHLWLPKAHVEAPITGSIVLAAVLLKLGGYGLYRFSFYCLPILSSHRIYIVALGSGGGLFRCFLCLRQSDLKSFVAYSSICHMGFFLAGFYRISFWGFVGSFYILIAHGFCSSCLFYLLYLLYERLYSRRLFVIKGLLFVFSSLSLSFFLFSALNMGVPPSFSFFSEVSILSGLLGIRFSMIIILFYLVFFAGAYGIFFYVISCHGSFFREGFVSSFCAREYINLYCHFFPLVFIPFYLNFFYLF